MAPGGTVTGRTRSRALAAAVAAAVVALAAGSFAGAARPAAVGNCTPGANWGTVRSDLAAAVVTLVNEHRASLGLSQLSTSSTLGASAVWKARHMAEYRYMTHSDPAPPVARTVPQRLEACGYPAGTSPWGENIAYGFSTAQAVMTAWLGSASHKANLERTDYRAIGVAPRPPKTGRSTGRRSSAS
jgi:uncharacterized protein YkwD